MKKEKIYYKTFAGFGNWKPFIIMDMQVYDIKKAIEIVRLFKVSNIGLATESQMKLNNAEWDNF
jgi:hypothetical protein